MMSVDKEEDSLAAEFQILPLVLNLLEIVVKDSTEELSVSKAANVLNDRIQKCQQTVAALPGIQLSKAQQEQLYARLCGDLLKKQKLLEQYKSLSVFQESIVMDMDFE
eukprot:TRINITY_DN7951_c0_g1_i1.p1 TRINITY_DN7951_c0_g1~~TRINITY_DN7951_c0_g1_i1.p1  ORF type:complete len:108 (+),score=26.43 TRINITY_DN7951_c0_g1_i1:115-438(+)